MKFASRRTKVELTNIRGGIDPTRRVWLSDDGVFGIHEHFECPEVFVLTHILTGIKFPYDFDTKKAAEHFANAIEDLTEWSDLRVDIATRKIVPESLRLRIANRCNSVYEQMSQAVRGSA